MDGPGQDLRAECDHGCARRRRIRFPHAAPRRHRHHRARRHQGTRPQRKLRFTWAWGEEDGTGEDVTEVTPEFHPTATGTRLALRHTGFTDQASRDKHTRGWSGCTDSLELYLAGK